MQKKILKSVIKEQRMRLERESNKSNRFGRELKQKDDALKLDTNLRQKSDAVLINGIKEDNRSIGSSPGEPESESICQLKLETFRKSAPSIRESIARYKAAVQNTRP